MPFAMANLLFITLFMCIGLQCCCAQQIELIPKMVRWPTHIDHYLCRQLHHGTGIRSHAVTNLNGDLCRTYCRIIDRMNGKITYTENVSPNFVRCGPYQARCVEGNCVGLNWPGLPNGAGGGGAGPGGGIAGGGAEGGVDGNGGGSGGGGGGEIPATDLPINAESAESAANETIIDQAADILSNVNMHKPEQQQELHQENTTTNRNNNSATITTTTTTTTTKTNLPSGIANLLQFSSHFG